MNAGLRTYKQASCRVAVPEAIPVELRDQVRELVGVKSESRNSGHATALLHMLTTEADQNWMTLMLIVEPFDDGMTTEQLEKFYEKHGFEVIQTEPAILMVRSPQRPAIGVVH